MDKIIYIAGKITGDKNYKRKFNKAEKMLKGRGFETLNPAKLIDPKKEYDEQMKDCLMLIDKADTIYLLKDWQDSKGAKIEKDYALNTGKVVWYE